jgi:hypothetical protein
VVVVLVVQSDDSVTAGRTCRVMVVEVPVKGWGPCWRDLSLFSGQPSAELKRERPASPFWLRNPSMCTMSVQVVAAGV